MSYYSAFYATLNSLESQNQVRRASTTSQLHNKHEKPSPMDRIRFQEPYSHAKPVLNPERYLDTCRQGKQRIETDNTIGRQRVGQQLQKSEQLVEHLLQEYQQEKEEIARHVGEEFRSKKENGEGLVQSVVARTVHLENMEALSKKSYISHFTI